MFYDLLKGSKALKRAFAVAGMDLSVLIAQGSWLIQFVQTFNAQPRGKLVALCAMHLGRSVACHQGDRIGCQRFALAHSNRFDQGDR